MSTSWQLGVDIGSVHVKVVAVAPEGERYSWVRPARGRSLGVFAELLLGEIRSSVANAHIDLEVCGTAGNSKHALEAVEGRQVDLVIIDMLLKNTTGVQVTEKLRLRYPSLYVLILSMSDEPYHVKRAFQAGARGYLTKDEVSEEIILAIRRVLEGDIYVGKRIARQCSKKAIASWILETDTKDFPSKI